MVEWFDEEGLVSDSEPNVSAAGERRRTRTTCRRRPASRPIDADELVLLDLWGKLNRPGAVFADITWVGYTGREVPERIDPGLHRRARRARRRRSRWFRSRIRADQEVRGFEVDRAAVERAARRRATPARSSIAPDTASANRCTATASTWTTTKPTTIGGCCRAPASRSNPASTSRTSAFGRKSI